MRHIGFIPWGEAYKRDMAASQCSVSGRLLIVAASLLIVVPSASGKNGLSIFGLWATPENRSHIDIQICAHDSEMLCGRVVWLFEENDPEGQPLVDNMNDDPVLRARERLGLEILWLQPTAEASQWSGRVYDPETGNVYRAKVALEEVGALAFQGCILFFCRAQAWPRVTNGTSLEHAADNVSGERNF